jgi:hypothetical protein
MTELEVYHSKRSAAIFFGVLAGISAVFAALMPAPTLAGVAFGVVLYNWAKAEHAESNIRAILAKTGRTDDGKAAD